MVPERILHATMVLSQESEDPAADAPTIIALQKALELPDEERTKAAQHIDRHRGLDGDWDGQRDRVLNMAADRVRGAMEDGRIPAGANLGEDLDRMIEDAMGEEDIFSALGVPSPEEKTRSGGDLLEEFGLEEEVKHDPVDMDSDFESEDDVDPFDLIGGRAEEDSKDVSPARDPLDALLDDDPDYQEDEDLKDVPAMFRGEEEGSKDPEPEPEPVEVEAKSEPVKEADPLEVYKMLLETVWVDDVLDPAEVALLARKRTSLGITFQDHLEIVREIISDSQ